MRALRGLGAALRRWRPAPFIVVTMTLMLLAIIHLGPPLVIHCTTAVLGGPGGDGLAGGVWLNWNWAELSGGPFRSTTPLLNAPFGAPLWQPHMIVALVPFSLLWVLSHLVGPVCAWNLALVVGLAANGLTMWLFLRWLLGRPWVAFIGAYAFAFTPYHIEKAQGHIGYVYSWAFPLLLWAVLAAWRRPGWKKALAVGATIALLGYTDGYYLVFGPLVAITFVVAAVLHDLGSGATRQYLLPRIASLAVGGVLAAVLLAPVALTFLTSADAIGSQVTRDVSEVWVYGARPQEYLTPPPDHPLLGDVFGTWDERDLHGSNPSEQTLYLGWTIIVLAGGYAIGAFVRSRSMDAVSHLRYSSRFLAVTVGAVGAAALVTSAPSFTEVLGRRIPLPSRAVFEVVPFMRVFARLFLVVDVALVTLASLGLAYLVNRARSRRSQIAIGSIVASVMAFELLAFPPYEIWSYPDAPAAYHWLDDVDDEDAIVAEYPLIPSPIAEHQLYLSYQPVHDHPLFNGAPEGTDRKALERGVFNLGDPQTVPALRQLGIEYVVIHTDWYLGELDLSGMPTGMQAVFADPPMHIYRVAAGPTQDVALGLHDGFYLGEATSLTGHRWMSDASVVDIIEIGDVEYPVSAGFTATSFLHPRRVVISQNGGVLWEGEIGSGTEISFDVPGPGEIEIRPETADRPVDTIEGSTDQRLLSINVTGLWARES